MYLKNLTALGFKSFANKTTLNFQPGVTAIVGPNGCGKSNVSDAIRWVLGEQSAKALRGGEMADVIFNGADGRKPLGMAEVSLTIGGVDEAHLVAAGVEVSYNEVTLTRRVFRDGGSEYFINRTPCRLKDVQQLFMGTGVGRSSYSIMAQGNITQILSSKPEDRRMIFEEAAGITKFKAHKKESLRKLEYTDQNLLRVADLIREVKRQIGSLQRQAGKARRYRQLMQELQHLDTQLARHRFDVLRTEINERGALAEQLRVEIEDSSAGVLRHEEEIAQLRERLSELEHQINEMQQRGLELKGRIEHQESRAHFNEERVKEIESQNSKALAEIAQSEARQLDAEQELASLTERLNASIAAVEQHRQQLRERQEAAQQLDNDLRQKQEAQRQAQSQVFAIAQDLARARNGINALDLQKQGNAVRLEKLSVEKIQLEEERSQLDSRLKEFAASVEADKLDAQTRRGTVEERQERLVQIQHELTELTRDLDKRLQEQAEKRSRLDVLEQLETSHEGFSAGALAALKHAQQAMGSLADKIRVPDQYITAVEAALGHNLQLVISENPEGARQILSDLSANRLGRASIAALAMGTGRALIAGTPHAEFPTVLSVIEANDSVRPLLQGLVGQTLIVPDLDTAGRVWAETHGAYDFVTQTGETLTRQGVFTGGSSNATHGTPNSILGRKNQIAGLQAAIASEQEQVSELGRRKGALMSEQTATQAGLHQDQAELRRKEVEIATREGEFNALQTSLRLLGQKIETVVYEIQSLAAQEEEGARKRGELAAEAAALEAREQSLQQQAAEAGEAVEELRRQREAAATAVTESRVAFASEEQICASFRGQQQGLNSRIQELRQLVEKRRSEISEFLGRKTQAETDIQDARHQIGKLQFDREQVNAQAADLLGQKETQEAGIGEREEELREHRRRLNDCQQQRGALEVELAQKNMSVQNVRERIQQKYHVNLDDIRSECITITLADEGPPKVQTLTPEEMAASGVATDWSAVETQVNSLQQRLDEMGPVNLVAIEEYEETEQRYNFLTAQHDDLVNAKTQLMDVINRINQQTRQMFMETFEKIRENFRAMFTEVFGGGKADLVLVGEGDALDSGIDIVARPPGKQLQTISLLSGGEQTMTAVALLFSIYQVKPSPFCVLDELDAPLDESNINRFIRVLQRFLAHSQFIIITHNKRTIGMADVLYGVTMEERGISKIVSVKFHKASDDASHATPLVPPAAGASQVAAVEDVPREREETLDLAMAK